MSERILVMGATGTVGSRVVDILAEEGADFLAATHDEESQARLRDMGVGTVLADYGNPDSLLAVMHGVARVFLVFPLHESMMDWARNAVAAAKEAEVKCVVRSSALGADPNAHFRLGRVHGVIDRTLEESGLPFVVLRPNSFMQNYLALAETVRESGILALPYDKAAVSFIDARDVAQAVADALLNPDRHVGRVYTLTGPEALDHDGVAEAISKASGREVTYRSVDMETAGLALEGMGMPEWNVHMILSVIRYAKTGYAAFTTKAVEHLTGKPARTFEQFAEDHASAWK